MGKFILLFVALPALELYLLIEVGTRIGSASTLALIVVTGVIGATLARWQGLGVIRTIQRDAAAGRVPASALADGVIILIAAAVLMTPGIITDAFGFLCLVPAFRSLVKRFIWHRLELAHQRGQASVHVGAAMGGGPILDIEPEPEPPPDDDGTTPRPRP